MAHIAPSGKLVLVVDDEPTVLRSVTTALATAGFMVIVAENGAAGLEAFVNSRDDIDVVLADVVMPFMSGVEMAERIQAMRSGVPVLLMTAYSDVVVRDARSVKFELIRKPFLPDDLIRAIRSVLST